MAYAMVSREEAEIPIAIEHVVIAMHKTIPMHIQYGELVVKYPGIDEHIATCDDAGNPAAMMTYAIYIYYVVHAVNYCKMRSVLRIACSRTSAAVDRSMA